MFKLILSTLILICSSRVLAADLTVNINNITQTKAPIICALFDNAEGFPMKRKLAKATINADIIEDKAVCVFKDIPAKQLAISIVEDLNNNGKVDTTFVGFPKEPWAVSNNVPAHTFGPPTFAEAAIDGASAESISIQLIKP